MILTVDFGTTVTKVALWSSDGLVTLARAELNTDRPSLGWAEQDPFRWWTSMVVGCAEARAQAPLAFAQVDVVSCSGARQSFVPVSAGAEPLGKGLLWSDRRARDEAVVLTQNMGGEQGAIQRTGVPVDAGSMAAKIAWLSAHEPERLAACDWIVSPRDLVLWRLTGTLVTDHSLASRTGLYDFDGNVVDELAGQVRDKLPRVVDSDTVVGTLRAVPAAELGLRPGVPVVIGAGDRQCEVLGAGASADYPMVSWGTTANVSMPVDSRPVPSPNGIVVSRGAVQGWVLEGGLSAAGSFLAWLSRIVGRPVEELAMLGSKSPVGARGVIAVPWLDGARAPWWRDDARAGFIGLGAAHQADDLARAVIESVAWEVYRCLELISGTDEFHGKVRGLTLGGSGSTSPLWVQILTATLGLPATCRSCGEAASAGAALLASKALGMDLSLAQIDPIVGVFEPDPAMVDQYQGLKDEIEHATLSILESTTIPR